MRSILRRTPHGIELDVMALIYTVANRFWICMIAGAVLGLAAMVNSAYFTTPQYTASVSVYVNNNTMMVTGVSAGDISASIQVAKTYNALIGSDKVLQAVLDASGVEEMTTGELSGKISAQSVDDTQYLSISVRDSDPIRAAKLANAFLDAAPEVLEEMVAGSSISVVDTASVPLTPSSPNVKKNTVLGFAVGVLLSMAAVVVWSILDTTVKSEAELQEWGEYPLLGVIPDLSAVKMLREQDSRQAKYLK